MNRLLQNAQDAAKSVVELKEARRAEVLIADEDRKLVINLVIPSSIYEGIVFAIHEYEGIHIINVYCTDDIQLGQLKLSCDSVLLPLLTCKSKIQFAVTEWVVKCLRNLVHQAQNN